MKIFKLEKNPPSLKLRRAREKHFIAFDLGTETIKGLLFKRINEKIIILKNSLQYLEPFGIFDSRFFETDALKKALSQTIKELTAQSKHTVKTKYTILSFPTHILKNQIFLQSFKRENPKEKIQEREAALIINTILNQAKNNISQEFAKKTGISAKNIHFLNLKVLEMKINGYEVSQLLGFSGKNLNFRLVSTFLLRSNFEKVEKIIQNLDLEIFKIADPAENLVLALGDKNISGIFLDIGGKISRITIIKKGKIQWISVFERGGDDFSQVLGQTLGMGKTEVDDFKIRYSKKILSEQVRKRIKEIFFQPTQEWFQALKTELRKTQRNLDLFPPTIFIFGGGSLLPEIQDILNEGDWETLPFFKGPTVEFLLPKNLKDLEDKTQNLTGVQSVPSLLICYGE